MKLRYVVALLALATLAVEVWSELYTTAIWRAANPPISVGEGVLPPRDGGTGISYCTGSGDGCMRFSTPCGASQFLRGNGTCAQPMRTLPVTQISSAYTLSNAVPVGTVETIENTGDRAIAIQASGGDTLRMLSPENVAVAMYVGGSQWVVR